jgi:hypothetical protein
MAAFLDGCRFNPTAGGTTDWTYSSAVTGYQSPAAAGVVNGALYKYRAESADLSQWELGEGAYNTSTGVLARTTVLFNSSGTGTGSGQSGAGSKISFSTVPQVAIVALAEDISNRTANLSDLSNAAAARTNLGSVGAIRVQKFTASGTYTPDSHLLYAKIEAVGGGGGGGGASGSSGAAFGAAGGGASSYSRSLQTASDIGASKTVTIGAAGSGGASGTNSGGSGGNTSVGTLCIANGGSGGGAYANTVLGAAGSGGTAGTGNVVASTGMPGSPGLYEASSVSILGTSGFGGSSAFGGGGSGVYTNPGAASGSNATGYGAGGGGGVAINTTSTAAGGNGSAGIVIITEFCSQ